MFPSIKEPEPCWRDRVEPDDINHVRRLCSSSGFFNNNEVEVAVSLVRERLDRGADSGYFFLFLELGPEVAGYTCYGPIACTTNSFDLYWVVVDHKYRGQGWGTLLLNRTEDAIAALGGRRLYIETSSREDYLPTRLFYTKNGYSQEAVIRDFYAAGDHKSIWVKSLETARTPGRPDLSGILQSNHTAKADRNNGI